MADSAAVVQMIQRIIADETADLRERVQHIEAKVTGTVEANEFVDNQPIREDGGDPPPQSEQLRELLALHKQLEERLDKIKAIHRLDATPVQYVRGPQGKMIDAPEGMWEITCVECKDHQGVWKEGEPSPPQCRTWTTADGA